MHKKSLGLLLVFAFLASSCSKVSFETKSGNDDTVTPAGTGPSPSPSPSPSPTPNGNITCNTFFNANATTVNVTSTAENPTVNAVCNPLNVTISWVVRNSANTAVTINGLSGAQSVGDFFAAGSGTYSVVAKATAAGYNDYTAAPIAAVVSVPTPPMTRITCDVKINGAYAMVDVRAVGANPKITTVCTPSTGSYVWTVVSNGANVTVPGLTGSNPDPNPDFLSLPPGLYDIYLQVSETGYLPYQSVNPLTVKVTPVPTKPMTLQTTVLPENNKLDLLVIVDDSNSMKKNLTKLADKMQTLTTKLTAAGFDWQMCATLTRTMSVNNGTQNQYWGASMFWKGNNLTPSYILKPSTTNVNKVFTDTLNDIPTGVIGSEDERPIKAAYWHLYNGDYNATGNSGCYRKGAAIAMVMVANEDERSYGGDLTQKYSNEDFTPLENDDLPQTLITQVNETFGLNKRFVYNSIVVRPGDTACKANQDAIGPKSHYGVILSEIANLTNGYVGSVCDSDYTNSLNLFKDQIVLSMKTFKLDCTPVGNISVNVSPTYTYTYTVNGKNVIFDPAVPVGKNVTINYNCVP